MQIADFNASIASSKIATEKRACLCGCSQFIKIVDKDRYGLWHPVVLCKKCGLILHSPSLTEKSFEQFYTSDLYRDLYDGKDFLKAAEERIVSGYGEELYAELEPTLSQNKVKKILEIGCGGCWNLFPFHNKGYSVVGYDYSPELTKFGRSHGMDIRTGGLDAIEGTYDLIILNQVLEHFTDIPKALEKIKSLMSEKTVLYIQVPNIDNFGLTQFQNAHVYYFSPRTFKSYLNYYGLKELEPVRVSARIHMASVFKKSTPDAKALEKLDTEFSRMKKVVRTWKIKSNVREVLLKLNIETTGRKIYQKVTGRSDKSNASQPVSIE